MTEAAIPSVPFLGRYPIGMQLRLGTQRCDLFGHRSFCIQSTHDILLSLYTQRPLGLRLLQRNPATIGQHAHSMQQPASSHGSVKSRQQRSQGPGLCHDRRIVRQLIQHHRRRESRELLVVAAR
jgi:hypothetical protein